MRGLTASTAMGAANLKDAVDDYWRECSPRNLALILPAQIAVAATTAPCGELVYVEWITRRDVRASPEARFVFGDNTIRQGYGGQAGAMRDEPNAIGVATKWFPGSDAGDFFSDNDLRAIEIVDADIDLVVSALAEGRIVYVPKDGLGTGLSELPTRAPALHQHIVNRFRALSGPDFPWGF